MPRRAMVNGPMADRVALHVSLLWGGSAPADARNNFRQTLFALRQTLGPASRALNVTVDSIVLDGTLVDVDVRRLEWLVARGHPPALVEATDVYRGDFLEGLQVD